MPTYKLTVNGRAQTVNAAADTPLIYVLRNDLELPGTRLGCGISQCGACAVLADGKEIRSCTTPVSLAVGKAICTVEGLPGLWATQKKATLAPDTLHPIQAAWIEDQVPQCGYCQSGMMIAAADLLRRNPTPTLAQVKEAFTSAPPSPHLCRCGTYEAIAGAVLKAAKAMQA